MICVNATRNYANIEEAALAPFVKYVAVIDLPTYTSEVLLALLETLNPSPAGIVVSIDVIPEVAQNVVATAQNYQNDPQRPHPNNQLFAVVVPQDLTPKTQATRVAFIKATIGQNLGVHLP